METRFYDLYFVKGFQTDRISVILEVIPDDSLKL